MIVVRVERHSAITGKVTELARAHIANDGTGTTESGNYTAASFYGRCAADLDLAVRRGRATHSGTVSDFPRLRSHVWNLVAKALTAMGYV